MSTAPRKQRQPHARHHLLTAAGVLLAIGISAALIPPHKAEATRNEAPRPVAMTPAAPAAATGEGGGRVALPLDLPALPEPAPETPSEPVAVTASSTEQDPAWQTAVIRPGDSLSTIFSRKGLSARQLQEVVALKGDTRELKKLFPGQELRLQIGTGGELRRLAYAVDETRTLRIDRTSEGLTSKLVEHPLERRVAHAASVIENSLFLAGQDAGLSDNLIMELAAIFGWDVDFALDIRSGDRFSVVYEQLYRDGEKVRDGDILAAEFVNRGTRYRAVRYANADGRADFYTPEGKSVRREFLRTPVAFTRISSRFTVSRRHPILNKIRAHKGVDYAAPTGTPVKVTGDGKITFLGRKGGYGNVVVVQHGGRYSTLYGHLSRFARGMRVGRTVRQGQVIAYVGMTGLATGPHLHYEFRIDGVHRNPLTVHLPDASPLGREVMADFTRQAEPLLAQLDVVDRTLEVRLAAGTGNSVGGEGTAIALNTSE